MISLIDDFLLYIKIEKGYSINTEKAYKYDLIQFSIFLCSKNIDYREVIPELLYSYVSFLKENCKSEFVIYRSMASIKSFYVFLKKEKITQVNRLEEVRLPKCPEKLPDILSVMEVDKIISTPNIETKIGSRDHALFQFLYATGSRVSEATTLKKWQLKDDHVILIGKKGKHRVVPIYQNARISIENYQREFSTPKCDYIFSTITSNPLDRVSVWKSLKKYADLALIRKNVYPHLFRHCFATHLLNNGICIRVLQELLGHSNINTTSYYLHLSMDRIKSEFKRCHPKFRKSNRKFLIN